MKFRLLTFAILLYVGLDFADPMTPGVFVFEPSDSVDMLNLDRRALPSPPPVVTPPAPPRVQLVAEVHTAGVTPRPQPDRRSELPLQSPRHLHSNSDSAPLSEDH